MHTRPRSAAPMHANPLASRDRRAPHVSRRGSCRAIAPAHATRHANRNRRCTRSSSVLPAAGGRAARRASQGKKGYAVGAHPPDEGLMRPRGELAELHQPLVALLLELIVRAVAQVFERFYLHLFETLRHRLHIALRTAQL